MPLFIFFCKDKKLDYALDGFFFSDSSLKEIFFRDGAFHDCENPNTEMLLDIRNCKINTDYISYGKMQSLLNAAIGLHVDYDNKHICSCSAIYITHTNILRGEETLDRFIDSPRKEIFFYNGNFYDCDIEKIGSDRPSPVNVGNSIHAVLGHQPGDIVFNKNGFKYKQFLCHHPLDSNVSLCQCEDGDILEVLNSNILSMSDFNNLTSKKIENAKDLHALYASCVASINPTATILPFDRMETEGCDIWIKFSEAMERKYAEK